MARIKAVIVVEVEGEDNHDPRLIADGLTLTLQDRTWNKVAFGGYGNAEVGGELFLDPSKTEVISWHEVE